MTTFDGGIDNSFMSSYVLDPLIAEARRRARQRRLVAAVAVVLVAACVALPLRAVLTSATASAAVADSGKQCTESTAYGKQCIDVRGSGWSVNGIQTSFDDTTMFWPNDKWRIDLERYDCNPIGKTKSNCWSTAVWHGKARTGDIAGPGNTALGAHFAQSRRNAYWPAFALPHAFRSNVWLCSEVAVYNRARGRWVYNGAGLSHGLRACVSVHG